MSWLDPTRVVPVTILSAARDTDPYGQDEPDWDDASALDTVAWVQYIAGGTADSETLVERDQQRTDLRVWLAPDTPITGRDRVTVGGESFEVIGPPDRWRTPWADIEHHVRADLRRVAGPS